MRGIGSGGLQNGAGGVVWAVRGDYLAELAAAPVVSGVEPVSESSGLTFAHQIEQTSLRRVRCGAATFTYSRTLPLAALFAGSDDRLGLQQLAMSASYSAGLGSEVEFEVWIDEETGASIAIPGGQRLQTNSAGECQADLSDEVQMIIAAAPIGATDPIQRAQQVEAISTAFGAATLGRFEYPLIPDPASTYVMAMNRADGFVVRRRGFVSNRPAGNIESVYSDYLFVTHMTRGNRYYGVASLRRGFVSNLVAAQSCQIAPQGQPCLAEKAKYVTWSTSAVAVHLATIPPI